MLNPCPLCGHKDDFLVNTEKNLYKCFSESNNTGGNIINYLQEKHGLSRPEAREMFKYDLCRVDRDKERALKRKRKETARERTGPAAARETGRYNTAGFFLPDEPGFIPINPFESASSQSRYRWNDIGISNLFADCYRNVSRFVPETKMWFTYDGRVWKPDVGGMTVANQAKRFTYYLLLICSKHIKDDDIKETWTDFVIKRMKKFARDNMIADAASVWPVSLTDFDRDIFAFNCLNRTVDLRTFETRKHDPNDFLSKMSNVFYDENAECRRWGEFISEVMRGDKDTAEFLQKSLGYALTGDTSEECFFILYGATTRNGKGTAMETALHLMGDYGRTAQPETVAQKSAGHGGGPTEDIARLKGSRFVNMSEPDKGLRLNSALVKQLTGGDTVTARFLNQNSFEYRPEYTLFINTNHLPRVYDDSVFASGRVRLIPFERHFSENEQDKGLKAFFKRPENISGIFNWFIEGLKLLRAEGLKQPKAVLDATARYRDDYDIIGQFIRERLIKKPFHSVLLKDVNAAYENWCAETGYKAFNRSILSKELRLKGMRVENGTGNKVCLFDHALADTLIPFDINVLTSPITL